MLNKKRMNGSVYELPIIQTTSINPTASHTAGKESKRTEKEESDSTKYIGNSLNFQDFPNTGR